MFSSRGLGVWLGRVGSFVGAYGQSMPPQLGRGFAAIQLRTHKHHHVSKVGYGLANRRGRFGPCWGENDF